jgi:erythromycin esterase-like protein
VTEPCEDEALAELLDLQKRAGDYANRDGQVAEDEYFFAEQNARLVVDAERYYRAMFRGGRDNTWNLRDTHMADSLDALAEHLTRQNNGTPAKIVVWAHNSHLGDARATEMGRRGELNLGQLVRERHGRDDTINIGFSTYHGSVTAASDWGGAAERKRVRPGMAGSYEALFHEAGGGTDFLLDLRSDRALADALREPRLERAIGVIYKPETERWSHYFQASLSEQFDAVLHFDETRAVEPLEQTPTWETGEPPETFPSGL